MRWSNKNVLVTGGAGLIGSCVAESLLRNNANITIFDNFSVGKMENVHGEISEVIRGDVCDLDLLSGIRDIDYIFHFGAPSSSFLFRKDPRSCITSTIYGFMNVLELSKTLEVKKVVYPSSGTVYGNVPVPQSEGDTPQPHTTYAICKLACEHLAKLYLEDVSSLGLRIFTGYGPKEQHKGEFASVVTQFWNSINRGEEIVVYGDGTQSRDFVYIDDVIEAAKRAAESSFSGIVNVGSGHTWTFNQLIEKISCLVGKDARPIYIKSPSNYVSNTLADTRRMKAVLQTDPLTLDEGLKRYLSINRKASETCS